MNYLPPGSLPVGQGRTESSLPERKIYLSQPGFFTSPEYRFVNRGVSNVEGLKLKITAHKTSAFIAQMFSGHHRDIECDNGSALVFLSILSPHSLPSTHQNNKQRCLTQVFHYMYTHAHIPVMLPLLIQTQHIGKTTMPL